jgi:hypothetical protein
MSDPPMDMAADLAARDARNGSRYVSVFLRKQG